MATKRRPKRERKFNSRMQTKLAMLFVIILLVLIFLNAKLTGIIIDKGEKYTKQVLSQQGYSNTTIPYRRGDITDRNGTVLATSEKVYNVILDCKVLLSYTKKDHTTNQEYNDYIEPTVSAISKVFEIDREELLERIEENPESRYQILTKKVKSSKRDEFLELSKVTEEDSEETKEAKRLIQGVWFEPDYQREYPYHTLACDVLGFTTSDNVGHWGMEEYYNNELNGVNGRKYGYLDEEENLQTTVAEPQNGNTVVSTIDANIQSIIERKIREFNEEHQDEAREGNGSVNTAVIIMQPKTGEVLGMASYPDFDLNNPRDLSKTGLYTQKELKKMSAEELTNAMSGVWRNFCITDTYEPGSTFKPITMAAVLEEGDVKTSQTYECQGSLQIGNRTINCSHQSGHGVQTMEESMMHSCNVSFMRMGFALGGEKMAQYQSMFNIGLKTNIDLPGETNTSGLVYGPDMGDVTLATNSFGQNFNVTMIEMASSFSAVINGGYYYQPHMVSKILNEHGGIVKEYEPTVLKKVISKKTSDVIKEYLYQTIENQKEGTGRKGRIPGYKVGGKTGTAEMQPRDKTNYLVSFISFAPVDDPEVVCYVVIDRPNVEKQSDSGLAATLSREILTELFPYLGIYPTEELTEDEITNLGGEEGEDYNPDIPYVE